MCYTSLVVQHSSVYASCVAAVVLPAPHRHVRQMQDSHCLSKVWNAVGSWLLLLTSLALLNWHHRFTFCLEAPDL